MSLIRHIKFASYPKLAVLLLGFVLILLATSCNNGAKQKTPPEVIARVDSRPITRDDLNRVLGTLVSGKEGGDPAGSADMSELKKSVLNELIEEDIVLEEARKRSITVTDEDLNLAVKDIMENIDSDAFYKAIIPIYGTVQAWRVGFRKKLLVEKVIDTVRASVGEVKDSTAKEYFKENIKKYKVPPQVHASMILVATEAEATKVADRLKAGEKFADLAREFSLGPEGENGGDLGFFGPGEMPEEFEKAVFKIKLNEPSDIVKTPYGYHIFLVHERNKGKKLKYKDVRLSIKDKLRAQMVEKKLRQWILELKSNVKIEILEEI